MRAREGEGEKVRIGQTYRTVDADAESLRLELRSADAVQRERSRSFAFPAILFYDSSSRATQLHKPLSSLLDVLFNSVSDGYAIDMHNDSARSFPREILSSLRVISQAEAIRRSRIARTVHS